MEVEGDSTNRSQFPKSRYCSRLKHPSLLFQQNGKPYNQQHTLLYALEADSCSSSSSLAGRLRLQRNLCSFSSSPSPPSLPPPFPSSSSSFRSSFQIDQDKRFSDKEAKLLRTTKFPAEFSQKVDMRKVNLSVMRPWMVKEVTKLIGFEDEVVVEYAVSRTFTSSRLYRLN